jgi:hypothetical protein
MRARSILAVLAIASLVTACGGDDDESSSSDTAGSGSASSSGTAAPDDTTDLSIDLGGEADFGEVDGLTVRFANVYWTGGEGTSIDIYWGPDPSQGELVTTLEYGEVSEYFTGKVNSAALDATDLVVSFVAEGETEIGSVLMSDAEELGPGEQVTYVFGAGDTEIGGVQAGSQQIVYERSDAGQALDVPDPGQALLFGLDLGLQAIPEPDADFVELGTADGCIEGAFGSTGNAGQAYPVDAGAVSVAAFDVNQSCSADSAATPFIDVDLADGDQVLLLFYGTAKDDRQVVAAPVE